MEIHHPLQFASGLLGNIISFMVFLAPLPTFYRICKKRSTEGFQSIPYVIALFSSTLWMYYAFLKSDAYLLITINSFGCVIETIYISIFLAYAPKAAKILTAKLLLGLNLGVFCVIVVITNFLTKGPNRVCVLGWICVAFSASVFAAPLSVMRLVIRTKSVEFMPFGLSFFLTLSAISWFSYGFLLKDIYIALPNVLGFLFGVAQMGLYAIYRNNREKTEVKVVEENKVVKCVEEHVIVVELTGNDENEVEKVIEPKPIDSVGSNVQCALDKASAVMPASSCQNIVCVEV